MPASGPSPPKSAGETPTSRAALLFTPSRANSLMPFVTTPPASEAAPTTDPPGHMQKV